MSIGYNPVVVRNLLGSFKKAGIVDVQRGSGGAFLISNPKDITIWTLYQAVDTAPLNELVGIHPVALSGEGNRQPPQSPAR